MIRGLLRTAGEFVLGCLMFLAFCVFVYLVLEMQGAINSFLSGLF